MTTARRLSELSVKLADAALIAQGRKDDVMAIFFATKAAEVLQLAKLLTPEPVSRGQVDAALAFIDDEPLAER